MTDHYDLETLREKLSKIGKTLDRLRQEAPEGLIRGSIADAEHLVYRAMGDINQELLRRPFEKT